MNQDKQYMARALELAKKGAGRTSPNPMVGAVIVKDGQIIGEGYHHVYGGPHAERDAMANCTKDPAGADMYVTLEPCCHYGKQPPCTEAIIEAGIRRVVVGSSDPNPLVSGKGLEILRAHGIQTESGILEEDCLKLNEVFFWYIQTGLPFVVLKYAMTMDGKIAAYTGKSQWITGEAARRRVHEDRNRYSAIMTGIGTVLADDPMLTCRIENGKNPVRIICDSRLQIPEKSRIVQTSEEVPTIIATCCTDKERQRPYVSAGCQIMEIEEKDGHLNLGALMEALGKAKIDSVYVEGGSELSWAVLGSGMVNRVHAYISPKILGGVQAKTPVGGLGFASPDEAVILKNSTVTPLGDDFLIESEAKRSVYRNH